MEALSAYMYIVDVCIHHMYHVWLAVCRRASTPGSEMTTGSIVASGSRCDAPPGTCRERGTLYRPDTGPRTDSSQLALVKCVQLLLFSALYSYMYVKLLRALKHLQVIVYLIVAEIKLHLNVT